jgi:hypothetical protein
MLALESDVSLRTKSKRNVWQKKAYIVNEVVGVRVVLIVSKDFVSNLLIIINLNIIFIKSKHLLIETDEEQNCSVTLNPQLPVRAQCSEGLVCHIKRKICVKSL